MGFFWRHRSKLREWFSEIGCGLLTVLFFTLPLWVVTVAWRGPRYAAVVLLGMLAVVVLVAAVSKLFKRRS